MVFISNEEYEELLEYKFKYELEHNEEKQSEEVNEEPREFKVGDKVRVINDVMGHLGDVATIIKIDNSNVPYKVKYESDGETCWYVEDYLELIEEREEK